MAVVFLEVGQEVHFEGEAEEAVQEGTVLVIQKDTFGNPLLEIPFCE